LNSRFSGAAREIYASTGLQFLPFNTLFQLLSLKNAKSSQLNAAKTLLFMPDLLHFWLCGQKKSEYTIASTSQMLNAGNRFWDEDLLRRFDLPTQILSDVVPPGSTLGNVRGDVAERLDSNRKLQLSRPPDTTPPALLQLCRGNRGQKALIFRAAPGV
jgi:sugar (pentulose or hexulose) kinase